MTGVFVTQMRRRPWGYANVTEITGMWPWARSWKKQRLDSQSLDRAQACRHLDFSPGILISGFWPPNCERIHLCCSEPPSLWQFVTAARGNWYSQLRTFPLWSDTKIFSIIDDRQLMFSPFRSALLISRNEISEVTAALCHGGWQLHLSLYFSTSFSLIATRRKRQSLHFCWKRQRKYKDGNHEENIRGSFSGSRLEAKDENYIAKKPCFWPSTGTERNVPNSCKTIKLPKLAAFQ